MKINYFLIVTSLFFVNIVFSQTFELTPVGGEYKIPNSNTECLSDVKRDEIRQEISTNVALLKYQRKIKSVQENKQEALAHPLFSWPVAKNPTSPYETVWGISNYVDHNPGFPNKVQDWNCGNRTYDTATGANHQGVDIFSFPFSLYMMDNSQAWAVAAAPGIITYKNDGNPDRNCALSNKVWNAVVLQHSDGSTSWYGHLKNGSLTTKNIGDTVLEGEFIGVVGSSGNSSAPHLHFEVYNSSNQLVDPYVGSCNNWPSSSDSWWKAQKPYSDPRVNAVLSHSAKPQFKNCPESEVPNLSDDFSVGSEVGIAIYLVDQTAGSSVTLTLKRPDNSLITWVTPFTESFDWSWWYWTVNPSNLIQQGTYQFTALYNGKSVTHSFNYGAALGVKDNVKEKFTVYPNPVKEHFTINSDNDSNIEEVKIYDLLGKLILKEKQQNAINVASLSKGIYVLKIKTDKGEYASKIIKE